MSKSKRSQLEVQQQQQPPHHQLPASLRIEYSEAYHSYSGLLPQADEMAKYEVLHKGMTAQMLTYVQGQATHRHSIEKSYVDSRIQREKWGQGLAFVIVLVALGCATTIALKSPDSAPAASVAVAIVGGTLALITGMFITGHWKEKAETDAKRKSEMADPPDAKQRKLSHSGRRKR